MGTEMQSNEGQSSVPIIMVNNTNIQPKRYIMQTPQRLAISKNFNGRHGAPVARSLSTTPNNITMIAPVNGPTTKFYRLTQQSNHITTTTTRSTHSSTDGLPVGSLLSKPQSPVHIEIASRPSPLSSPETSDMEPAKKRIRNNKDYDNYSPSTFKPGPKPSVDDHLLDERALDRRKRRRKMQDYETIIDAITAQRDEAQRKVVEMSALLHRIVQAHPDVSALIDEPLTNDQDNVPLEAIELKRGRARDEFYVAKTELLDDEACDNVNNGAIVIEQKEEEDVVTDVIKLEAAFDD